MNSEAKYDLIVIGAGAAGLMAAGEAAARGLSVLLLDKNAKVGRKLMITGKGRCNVTNNCNRDEFLQAVRRNPRFLYSAIDAFAPEDTMSFFEKHGVPLKTERGRRVFPVSDKSLDIVDALFYFIKDNGVVLRQSAVKELLMQDGAVTGVRLADGNPVCADAVLVATGGLSYPTTGSTGDGYVFARAAGHTVTELSPSLCAIETKDNWREKLMGLSLKNVTMTVQRGKKRSTSEIGEMMFTHFGVSGPLVLTLSSEIEGDISEYSVTIDLKPALDLQKLDARLLRDFNDAPNRAYKTALERLMPKSFVPVFAAQSGIAGAKPVNSITKEERRKICETLKTFRIMPSALRPVEEAVVTRGGVKVSEISPKTMESKLVKGLYFAGEVLDLDAITGGYNLQIAFSTGYLAGVSIAGKINEGEN